VEPVDPVGANMGSHEVHVDNIVLPPWTGDQVTLPDGTQVPLHTYIASMMTAEDYCVVTRLMPQMVIKGSSGDPLSTKDLSGIFTGTQTYEGNANMSQIATQVITWMQEKGYKHVTRVGTTGMNAVYWPKLMAIGSVDMSDASARMLLSNNKNAVFTFGRVHAHGEYPPIAGNLLNALSFCAVLVFIFYESSKKVTEAEEYYLPVRMSYAESPSQESLPITMGALGAVCGSPSKYFEGGLQAAWDGGRTQLIDGVALELKHWVNSTAPHPDVALRGGLMRLINSEGTHYVYTSTLKKAVNGFTVRYEPPLAWRVIPKTSFAGANNTYNLVRLLEKRNGKLVGASL